MKPSEASYFLNVKIKRSHFFTDYPNLLSIIKIFAFFAKTFVPFAVNPMISFKQKCIQHYNQYLNDHINSLREMIVDLTEDSKNDAKGSAGDKHETGLAMMHLEQEKLNRKLLEVLEAQNKFLKIDYSLVSNQVILGSLIQTEAAYFLMVVALPKIEIDGKFVFGMSPQSPLGELFMGKKVNDSIVFNGNSYIISGILI